jgi:hypothetical protein
MTEQVATIVEIKHFRPVKWSAVDKKVEPYRLGYVHTFLAFEGRPLLEEDGTPMRSTTGRYPLEVTMNSFAKHCGIPTTTFQDWVYAVRGPTTPREPDTGEGGESEIDDRTDTDKSGPVVGLQHHGQCNHCPEWEEK